MAESAGTEEIAAAVLRGETRICGRLITRVEAGDETVVPVIQALYRLGGKTPIIGITGPPGAGKSSLADQLIARYRAQGKRVAVLAVDPSSPFSGGAILGDRVRMGRHNTDAGVFIRSMSSRGRLGGLARAAGEALIVLDAMGVDLILVETVGVGQNEIDIMRHAQTVLLLQTPTGGDAVQAVKAGILEIGDVFAVNKADTPGADRIVSALREAVDFRVDPHDAQAWHPPILKTQATDGSGIDALIDALQKHADHLQAHPEAMRRRQRDQARIRLLEQVSDLIRARHAQDSTQHDRFEELLDQIVGRTSDPYSAATRLLDTIQK